MTRNKTEMHVREEHEMFWSESGRGDGQGDME